MEETTTSDGRRVREEEGTFEPNNLTVIELKERLKARGLPVAGSKAELILRLMEAGPANSCLTGAGERGGGCGDSRAGVEEREDALRRREVEFYRREKELAERELELARREISMLRGQQRGNSDDGGAGSATTSIDAGRETLSCMQPRINLTMMGDLVSDFDGVSHDFDTWEKQIRFMRTAYRLEDDCAKILISMKLKKKAFEWFHSRSEHISMPFEMILEKLRAMFQRRESKLTTRRKFENRIWKREESFQEYLHDKIIMGNRVPIDDGELIEHIVDGIPDATLRDQARIQGFESTDALLRAFERISLRDRTVAGSIRRDRRGGGLARGDRREWTGEAGESGGMKGNDGKGRSSNRRCFNCGAREHISANCPTKDLGMKCFECGKYGHIASKCSKKNGESGKTIVASISRITSRKSVKDVSINGRIITALIDTGSDITIMRADEHAMVGSPRLRKSEVEFCGVGGYYASSFGEFRAPIMIDGITYSILVRVVPDSVLQYGLLLGTDFLTTVEANFRGNLITISPIHEETIDGETRPEIFAIDVQDVNTVDISGVQNVEHKRVIAKLIENYQPSKTRELDVKMTIILKDEEPIYQKARRLSQVERDLVNAQIDEWERQGIVRPSISDFASPVVIVKKKDGSSRLCVDYRMLNKKIIKDRYPLPLIEDQLDHLQGARVFSTLDLRNGFFHVRMDDASIKYTSFVVPDGQYEFLRVPFGLCNSPSVFQRFVNEVFRDLIKRGIILIYMDDLIVLSENESDGLRNLEVVLEIASHAGLMINWRKCHFLQRKVEFLGYIVECGTMRPSERKIEAVVRFPEPRDARQVQAFLGLSGYFRKFIPRYSLIARPLSNLLRANVKFDFGMSERDAFRRLKTILSERPVLSLYRVGAETELHTDASMYGYGAILLQRNDEDQLLHPIYYASGKTTPAEEKYTSYELEVLAVIRALKRFRVYLLGINFKIVTDCRAFALTMSKRDLCVRVARWALLLEEFRYTIEHRPGKNMVHVDALSRNPLPCCLVVSECEEGVLARLRRAQREDRDLRRIFGEVERGESDGCVVRDGILYKDVDGDVRVIVPKAMRRQIVRRAHEQGHFGVTKTEALLRRDYWIPGLHAEVGKVVRNCVACILAERKHGKPECFLNPIEKGSVPLDTFHVDYLGPLPSTRKSYVHIFVVVDAFSKFVWLYATRSTSAADAIERLRRQSFIFGNPRRIVSDRGSAFTSEEFGRYCRSEGIGHRLIVTGVPRGNGQVERVNRTLIPLLTKLSAPKPDEWYKYLDMAQLYLNSTLHRSIGTTPFQVLLGLHPRIRENPDIKELLESELIASFNGEREELRERAQQHIHKIQEENKRCYDKKRKKPFVYREGDLVAIKRTQQGPGRKLAHKYLGPYEVDRILRNHRYAVRKVGEHEGPLQTSSVADYMKPWIDDDDDIDDISENESEEMGDEQSGRQLGQDGRV